MWLATKTRFARPRLQELEDRSLFSVNFPGLADFLAAADKVSGRLDTLHNNLVAQVNSIKVDLPVLNDGLDGVQEAKSFLDAVRAKLHDALQGLGSTTDPGTVRQAVFDALGPNGSGIDVLGNQSQDQDPAITPADVGVLFSNNNNNIDITLHLHKVVPVTGTPFNFGVGLPGLGMDAQGAVHVDLTFDYEPLTIKVTNTNSFAVDTTAVNEINLGVSATIPGGQSDRPARLPGLLGDRRRHAFRWHVQDGCH